MCNPGYPFIFKSKALKGWLQPLDSLEVLLTTGFHCGVWQWACPSHEGMSECEGFSLVSPEKTPPNTSLGNSCLSDGALAREQEKGALSKISRNPFGDPTSSWSPVPAGGSLSNLNLLENESLSWLYRVSQGRMEPCIQTVTSPLF